MTRAWAVALASAVLSRVAADGMIRNAEAYWVRGARRPAIPPPALADAPGNHRRSSTRRTRRA